MRFRIFLLIAMSLIGTNAGMTQQRAFTAADYQRAEKFMGYNTNPLVLRSGIRPTWLPDETFWYRATTEKGSEFTIVNPATGTKDPAFDHSKVAAALSKATAKTYSAYDLPFQQFEMSPDSKGITITVDNARWTCDRLGAQCTAGAGGRGGQRGTGQRGRTKRRAARRDDTRGATNSRFARREERRIYPEL
jgi:hypothetical protein